LPAAPDEASRVEHRVSGADANPYLMLACILQGMWEGMREGQMPPPPLTGNGYDEATPNRGPALPTSMEAALAVFDNSQFAIRALGQQMHHCLACIKRAEISGFADDISPLERGTYL